MNDGICLETSAGQPIFSLDWFILTYSYTALLLGSRILRTNLVSGHHAMISTYGYDHAAAG